MNEKTKKLVLGGVMVALSTALSFVKFADLPYGGSITLCSMLPVLVFGYLCGVKWGLGAGFTFSVLELLFGLSALKGISGAMVVGSILLDYLLAFTVLGLGGMFKGRIKNDAGSFTLGAFVCCMLRYLCSFLSGWLLWAQFSEVTYMREFIGALFPAGAALSGTALAVVYSLVYNGLYMVPETIVTCAAGFLVMQFAGKQLKKMAGEG